MKEEIHLSREQRPASVERSCRYASISRRNIGITVELRALVFSNFIPRLIDTRIRDVYPFSRRVFHAKCDSSDISREIVTSMDFH